MANKSYTLIVVPDTDAAVRRYRVQKNLLVRLLGGVGLVVLLAAGASVHYAFVAADAAENEILRDENLALRTQLKQIRERIDHVSSTLERVERFDQKLRAVTLLSDPQRNLALGPTEREPGQGVPVSETQFTRASDTTNAPVLSGRIDKLSA